MACAAYSCVAYWRVISVIFLILGVSHAMASNKISAESTMTNVNVYGDSIDVSQEAIKDAVVEHVKLYVRESADSDKKIERSGILVRYKNAVATILICHGFMCDKFDVAFLRHLFPRGKFNFMTFDFRAHGENVSGQCCTFGRDEAYDVIAAGSFLKNHSSLKDKPLFVYGFSMGAVASIEAQAKAGLFDAMILDCPFDSTENVIKKNLEKLKLSLFGYEFDMPGRSILQKYAFHPYVQSLIKLSLKTVARFDAQDIQTNIYPVNPVESIKKVQVPCLFIHCKNDEKIPVESVKSVYHAAAANYKVLWLTNGRRHFDSLFYNPEKYTERICKFLDRAVSRKVHEKVRNKIIEDDEVQVLGQKLVVQQEGEGYGV